MAEISNGSVIAEAVGVTSVAYIGGKSKLKALSVEVNEASQHATVWALLRDHSIEAQLDAITAFSDVRECYADELELDFRFGEPSSSRAAVKALVHA